MDIGDRDKSARERERERERGERSREESVYVNKGETLRGDREEADAGTGMLE